MSHSFSDAALQLLKLRYLLQNGQGNVIETPDEMFRRVANAVAKAELKWHDEAKAKQMADRFYEAMSQLEFLPNSPTLMNAGTDQQQLSACFVLPIENHIDSIFKTLHATAIIQEQGGGTGFDFSHIHGKAAGLNNTSGTTCGPLAFISLFNDATSLIRQAGKRRGANMGVLQITHPDILDFIRAKENSTALQQFNLSIGITDDFMKAVMHDKAWQLLYPDSGNVFETFPARILWKEIVSHAHGYGDPGLLFVDTIERHHPLPELGKITCTNPCGEVPLLPFESCNLGSINVAAFVKEGKIAWNTLAEMIHTAIRFLDDVIEVNTYLLPETKNMAMTNRKIGLGIMGWADMLLQLRLPYDSDAAVAQAGALMQFFRLESRKASIQLAAERGVFPNWQQSMYATHEPMRNTTVNSIAPTGSICIIADAAPSIEPLFALAYHRKHVLENQPLPTVNKYVQQILQEAGHWNENIMHVIHQYGTVADIEVLPENIKNLLKTATEIPPMRHLQHQLAFQRYTDNAVSKTINLSADTPEETVADLFLEAWKGGAKGITVFRQHNKERQVFVAALEKEESVCKVCR